MTTPTAPEPQAEPDQSPAEAHGAADTVQLVGVKDGVETVIGTATMPPKMKARELVREMFGAWEPDDGSDADMAFAICEQLIEWMPKNPPTFNVESKAQPKGTRVTGRELNRFSVQGANIYDHLDQADVLIRVDGDWESEADRDQYVNALAARLQAPAPAPDPKDERAHNAAGLADMLSDIADENSLELTDAARWALDEAAEMLRAYQSPAVKAEPLTEEQAHLLYLKLSEKMATDDELNNPYAMFLDILRGIEHAHGIAAPASQPPVQGTEGANG